MKCTSHEAPHYAVFSSLLNCVTCIYNLGHVTTNQTTLVCYKAKPCKLFIHWNNPCRIHFTFHTPLWVTKMGKEWNH